MRIAHDLGVRAHVSGEKVRGMPPRNAVVPAALPPGPARKPAYPAKRPVLDLAIGHLFGNEPPDAYGANVPECRHFVAAYFDAPSKSAFLEEMQTPQGVYRVMGGRVAALNERFDQIAAGLNEQTARVVHDDRFGLLLEHVCGQMFNNNAAAELNGALLGDYHSIAMHMKLKADHEGRYVDISVYDYLKKTNHVRMKKVRDPAELRELAMADFVPEWEYGFSTESRRSLSGIVGFPGHDLRLPPPAHFLCQDMDEQRMRESIDTALEFHLGETMDCLARHMYATGLRGPRALAVVQPLLDGEAIQRTLNRGNSDGLVLFGCLLAYCRIPGVHLVRAMAKNDADGKPWLHEALHRAMGQPEPNIVDAIGQVCDQLNVDEGPVRDLLSVVDAQGKSAVTRPMEDGDAAMVQSFANACLRQRFPQATMIDLLAASFEPGLVSARNNGHTPVLQVVRQALLTAGARAHEVDAFIAGH